MMFVFVLFGAIAGWIIALTIYGYYDRQRRAAIQKERQTALEKAEQILASGRSLSPANGARVIPIRRGAGSA